MFTPFDTAVAGKGSASRFRNSVGLVCRCDLGLSLCVVRIQILPPVRSAICISAKIIIAYCILYTIRGFVGVGSGATHTTSLRWVPAKSRRTWVHPGFSRTVGDVRALRGHGPCHGPVRGWTGPSGGPRAVESAVGAQRTQ